MAGPEVAEDQFENYAPHNMRTYSHYAGTCRMGSDATAVVDPELRVHGVSGLRVADASIMPRPRVRQHQCHRRRHRRTGRRPPRSIKMTSMGSDHKRGHRAPATPRGTAFGTLPAVGGVLVGLNARHLTVSQQFVQHVLVMDTINLGQAPGTRLDPHARWRALNATALQDAVYIGIIIWEHAAGLVLVTARAM
jgi:hypothetical protein